MQLAIFGISNDALNLAVTLLLLMLVAVYFALIVWTYLDSRRRVDDGVLVGCATAGAMLFPFIGAAVYSILRPPELLEDARERELEIRAAELRVRQLSEQSCPNCSYPVEKTYLRCPNCQRRLKDPCQSCGKPVDPRWALCPYCENVLPGRQPQQRRGERREEREEDEPRKRRGEAKRGDGAREKQGRRGRRAGRAQAESGRRASGGEQD